MTRIIGWVFIIVAMGVLFWVDIDWKALDNVIAWGVLMIAGAILAK